MPCGRTHDSDGGHTQARVGPGLLLVPGGRQLTARADLKHTPLRGPSSSTLFTGEPMHRTFAKCEQGLTNKGFYMTLYLQVIYNIFIWLLYQHFGQFTPELCNIWLMYLYLSMCFKALYSRSFSPTPLATSAMMKGYDSFQICTMS